MNNVTISRKKAQEIIQMCEKIESWTAIVKAEMKVGRGGVGTAPPQQKKPKSEKRQEQEEKIRARFYKK